MVETYRLLDDSSVPLTDEFGNNLVWLIPSSFVPSYGRSRREHGLGGAIYKIVNSPGP